MSFEIRPYPTFSWSHSRDRTLVACARRYYMHYYGAHNGWMKTAGHDSRSAYVLKHLTTLELLLGLIIHDLFRRMVLAIKCGQLRPTREQMLQRVREELNRACLSSHYIDAFAKNPTQHVMLREVWRHGERDKRNDERIRAKMIWVIDNLADHEIWDELETCPSERVEKVG